ncbi:endo-alpha-1,4-polygalactosaminidase (GH114 family) [Bacillus ectoiniformans]|uniref:endo alpha-1,4 polygalactosaminidase n=1 Tax=Bacillus ectoiniformans TaxID=1494429 RepID=UPI001957A0A6|nr:endo alpha-1,4 polygalactosaminidase [Bacillus ectoiniformans]MBM7649095.1 endo-alpha-1,4-polygalactosaminidase (GH114 family) [Bacillus ectoiniformans]
MDTLWLNPLHQIKTFQIFYGKPDKEKITELSKLDAAIIEATAFKEDDLNVLKSKGVKLFGYVSLMQLENWNAELKDRVQETDYAKVDGEKIYIKEWDTYVMDIREEHYRQALLWKVEHYIADQKLDGVFFDTVDDLDYYFRDRPAVLEEMQAAYRTLLNEIHKRHPDMLIIQNQRWGRIQVWTVVEDEKSRKFSDKHHFPAFVRKGDTYQK